MGMIREQNPQLTRDLLRAKEEKLKKEKEELKQQMAIATSPKRVPTPTNGIKDST